MKFFLLIFIPVFITVFLLLACQHKMIYFPRAYGNFYQNILKEKVVAINYITDFGKQLAFYVPAETKPELGFSFLWIAFGGNGSLALDWYDFVKNFPDKQAAFLLIDYPGYGKCQGKATPERILDSSTKAFFALLKYLNIKVSEVGENRIGLLGHSLGAAASLQFATRVDVARVILISPFTSMKDMACKIVGKPLCFLLQHNYNNNKFILQLTRKNKMPKITIIHGDKDEIIPVSMGRSLKKDFSAYVKYIEIKNGDHNSIIFRSKYLIQNAMLDKPLSAFH